MSIFTNQQTKALHTDRHLLVTANAGAGKTTVLVRRFAEIVLSGKAKVHEVVAITYTEKAAGELRRKIAEYIEALFKLPDARDNSHELLHAVRNQLSSATIGTIHSFCSQILREYPVEADIDAAFTVLEGPDQHALIQESLRESFEKILQSNETSEQRMFIEAVRMLGKNAVQKYLTLFLSNREKMERLVGTGGLYDGAKDDHVLLQRWNSVAREAALDTLADSKFLGSLSLILERSNGKSVGAIRQKLSSLASLNNSDERFSAMAELLPLIFTAESKIRKEITGKGFDDSPLAREMSLVCERHRSVCALVDAAGSVEGEKGNQTLLRISRSLFSVYHTALEIYDEKKRESGLLDFEDLQLKARDLLHRAEVREKLAKKFTFVMVDEFQDTNRLQYEILMLLISEYKQGNLFIVGDPKQSIYGFRNAEVEMFEKAKEDILGLHHTHTGEEVVLAESFRPLSNIALFVNLIFSHIMGEESQMHGIPHANIVKGRMNDAEGRVEFLMLNNDGDENPVAQECAMVAGRIQHIIQSAHLIYEGHGESSRPVMCKDIAILLRNRKHVAEIELGLASRKIPYRLTGGIGFYQTQEVFDILNYFSFLLSREDDVALAGILRSPFFNISDADLFEISLSNHAGTFWGKTLRYAERSSGKTSVRRAVALLHEDIRLANRLSIPFLVQRILGKTGWRGSVAGFEQGDQHSSNIDKLVNLARNFEGRGLHALYDFVQRLKSLVENQPREGQANVDTQHDCVQVMTIHAAKGLEFPVVFLPFAHEQFQYDTAPLIDPDCGIGFSVTKENNLDEKAVTPFYEFLQYRNRLKIDAEEQRIFYVGATRARDMVVVSGKIEEKMKKPSYLSWALEAMDVNPAAISAGPVSFKNRSLNVLRKGDSGYRLTTETRTLDVHFSVNNVPVLQPGLLTQRLNREKPDGGKFILPIPGTTQGEIFSATQIKTFVECPSKYYLKYLLGLPEVSAVPYDFHEEEEASDEIKGEIEGSLTHAVLQAIQGESVSETEIRKMVMQLLSAGDDGKTSLLIDSVTSNVMSFVSSSFGKKVLAAAESRTEFCLNTIFHEDYLTGIIDRIYKTSDGTWSIVDYKTDKVSAGQIQSRALVHKPQLAVYAYLVHKWSGQNEVTATLLLLRHPDKPVHFVFGKKDFQEFEREVESCIKKIKQNNFDRTMDICESCTYQKNHKCLISREQAV